MITKSARRAINDKRKRKGPVVRPDLIWKGLLESFLYHVLEIFYPQLHAAVDLDKPPSFLNKNSNKELRVLGLYSADKKSRFLNLLCDLPIKNQEGFIRLLLHTEVEGEKRARVKVKETVNERMNNYACVITLAQKHPFASLVIRTTPQGKAEKFFYEMDCFGTRHLFEYPTVFLDQLDEDYLLSIQEKNPVALAALCAKRMLNARNDEKKRYEYTKEFLKIIQDAGYPDDAPLHLIEFIEGMSKISFRKWVKNIHNTIDGLFEEMKQVERFRTPILRSVARRKAYQWGREEAKAEGMAQVRVEGARNLLKMGLSIKQIAEAMGLSVEDVQKLKEEK